MERFQKKDTKIKDLLFLEEGEDTTIKLVWKNKNLIMKNIEEKFEQDDYLQLNKLESAFNTTLINGYYNYAKKILIQNE